MAKFLILFLMICVKIIHAQIHFVGSAVHLLDNETKCELADSASNRILTIFPMVDRTFNVTVGSDSFLILKSLSHYAITSSQGDTLLTVDPFRIGTGGKILKSTGEQFEMKNCRHWNFCIMDGRKNCLVKGKYELKGDHCTMTIVGNSDDMSLIISMAYSLTTEAKVITESNDWLNLFFIFNPAPVK